MTTFENSAVTVTAVAPASSATLAGSADRSMTRLPAVTLSSSVRVRLVPLTVRAAFVPETVIVSSPSTRVSSVGVRVKGALPLVWPAAMVMSKSVTAV